VKTKNIIMLINNDAAVCHRGYQFSNGLNIERRVLTAPVESIQRCIDTKFRMLSRHNTESEQPNQHRPTYTEELDRGDTLAARAETGLRQNTTTRIASVHHRILEFIPLLFLTLYR
jgi:hypothetical protein